MERNVADKVLSDVHVFTPHETLTDTDESVNRVTRFYFSLPPDVCRELSADIVSDTSDPNDDGELLFDDDGDVLVTRKPLTEDKQVITIEHMMETKLDDVGLQVWQGCLLLCDFVLHLHKEFKGNKVLDLGAGVGLTSIVAGLFAESVLVTDVGETILSASECNIALNKPLLGEDCTFRVKELNWLKFSGPKDSCSDVRACRFKMTADDHALLDSVSLILAAEVIYDPDLTDAFFSTVTQLMSRPPAKTLYMTLEKRLVFTLADLDVVSPAYEHFREMIQELSGLCVDGVTFHCCQIHCDFPQYFTYDRHKHLELWQITSCMAE
ncbi:methyltransferase-like protein 22 isoform X1 [Haliotis rubra]|uniref:methyltransferase-like protein 22 isoform X1 n=1 Tax=Haliotis rubra TaxID=36100 RepID=UPI001EE5F680|nr:methyltransferase-like protein 22 isoform X1 [Haliotis rubra]